MAEILRSQRIDGALLETGFNLLFQDIEFFVPDEAQYKQKLKESGWKHYIPFYKHTITWPQKRILHRLTGIFRSSRSTAILGPSGAGKTSLLSLIVRE